MTKTEYIFPPDEYLRTCHPAFDGNSMRDIIVGMDAAIGRCNSRIRAIVSWKEEALKNMPQNSNETEEEQ